MAFIKANKKGITLVETIVYLAVVGLIVSGFIYFAINLQSVSQKSKTMADLESQLRLANQQMGKWIRQADDINPGQSVLGVHPGRLSLAEGNKDALIYINQNGRLQLDYHNQEYLLTGPGFTVSRLVFAVFDENLVEIELELTGKSSTVPAKKSSQTTYYLHQKP